MAKFGIAPQTAQDRQQAGMKPVCAIGVAEQRVKPEAFLAVWGGAKRRGRV